jgi:hypothetical protein
MAKLSELMRQGAATRPQAFGDYTDASHCCTCAMGAVYEAITGKLPHPEAEDGTACSVVNTIIYLETDILLSGYIVVDPISHESQNLSSIISGLNDELRWTREEIADWLESEGL